MNKLKILIIILLCITTRIGVAQTDTMQVFYEKVDKSFSEMRKSKNVLDDSIYYYFTENNISKIKKQLTNNLVTDLDSSIIFDNKSLFKYLSYTMGIDSAKKSYIIFINNSTKVSLTERNEILAVRGYPLEKRKQEVLNLQISYMKSGETFKLGTDNQCYKKIDSIPDIISKVFPNVTFYYLYNYYGFTEKKYLKLLYMNNVYTVATFNNLYLLQNPDNDLSIDEKIICLLYFYENMESKIDIISIVEVTKIYENGNENILFNYKVDTKVNGIIETFYLVYDNNQFLYILKYIQNEEQNICPLLKY
jgi:hypothetical protein